MLFVAEFKDLFVVAVTLAQSLTDDEAVASGFDDFERDSFAVIDAEDAFDLSKQPREEPQVAVGYANKPCGDLRFVDFAQIEPKIGRFLLGGSRLMQRSRVASESSRVNDTFV